MRRAVLAVLASSIGIACAADPAAPAAAPPPPVVAAPMPATASVATSAPEPRDDSRLPGLAAPVHYAVALEVDPTMPRFKGRVTIDVDVPQATSFLVLHGRDQSVTDASVTAGGRTVKATTSVRRAHGSTEPEELVLALAEPLPAGRAQIAIAYDAPFSPDLGGLYRVKEGDRWYAFTQFEATDARRAFPCFDEPAYKVPFDLSVTAPRGMIAVANTPEKARAEAGASTRFDFATSPPLPSYLVALAVGDFDVREGPKDVVPIRLISVKGKSPLGDGALEATAGLVKKLGDYFAIPYPFAKLDIVAVPDFAAGAMENPGLITFREELLLQDPKRTSNAAKRGAAITIAHELAHIWFGDLVTMQWWNDVWLNEGFATWMETKVVDEWRPDYAVHLEAVSDMQNVMDTDALANARAVRQPVTSKGDVSEAFDGITYQKGAAVLSMIEHWIGPDVFQRGVRDYMKAHSWKNARAEDLLGALDHASGRDVSGMASTFIDRPGVPNVAMRSTCAPNKSDKPATSKLTLDFAQTAWRPLGVAAKASDASPWRIPVCVHEPNAKSEACTDLAGASASVESQQSKCPAWSYPNAGEAGYYRYSLTEDAVRALARDQARLDVPSRIGLVSNLWAQVRAGALSPAVFLDVLPAFDHESDRHVVEEIIATLTAFDHALVEDAARPAFRRYVAARMAAHERALGWHPKPGESEDVALLRPEVISLLGRVARDPATLKEAQALTKKWLADPGTVDADVGPIAVRLASMDAGPARIEELRAVAKNAKTPFDRVTALRALGYFDDPTTLKRVFDLLLTDEVKMQDLRYVLTPVNLHDASSRAFFGWLQTHWDAMRAKLPGSLPGRLPGLMNGACSKDLRDMETGFFEPRVKDMEGARRPMAEAAERATSCAELRAHGAPDVTTYFAHKK